MVRAAHPAGVLHARAARVAGLRAAARAACGGAAGDCRRRQVHPAAAARTMDDVGVYSMAVSFGLTQKLFLSAFESAWAPFYYATIREADATRMFRAVTTYGVAVLALLTAGLSAVGRDAAKAMTHGRLLAPDDPRWADVSTVITWTAIGVFFQGIYLLTSIGLNITKRTQFYPVATMTAAATNVGLNFLLIPQLRDGRRGVGQRRRVRRAGGARLPLLAALLSDRLRAAAASRASVRRRSSRPLPRGCCPRSTSRPTRDPRWRRCPICSRAVSPSSPSSLACSARPDSSTPASSASSDGCAGAAARRGGDEVGRQHRDGRRDRGH